MRPRPTGRWKSYKTIRVTQGYGTRMHRPESIESCDWHGAMEHSEERAAENPGTGGTGGPTSHCAPCLVPFSRALYHHRDVQVPARKIKPTHSETVHSRG